MWLDVKFPLHPALAAGLTSWIPSFHSTVTTQWQTRDLTSCWQTPLPCTPLVLDLFPISAYGITMTHVFVNPNCYGVMPFIINFQHRIPSKKLKKSNMLTKKLKKSNVLTKLPWRRRSKLEKPLLHLNSPTQRRNLCANRNTTQQDKQNCFKVVEHFVEHGKRLEAPKP